MYRHLWWSCWNCICSSHSFLAVVHFWALWSQLPFLMYIYRVNDWMWGRVCLSYQQPAGRESGWSQQRMWWGRRGRWPRPGTVGRRCCPGPRTSTSVLWRHTHKGKTCKPQVIGRQDKAHGVCMHPNDRWKVIFLIKEQLISSSELKDLVKFALRVTHSSLLVPSMSISCFPACF